MNAISNQAQLILSKVEHCNKNFTVGSLLPATLPVIKKADNSLMPTSLTFGGSTSYTRATLSKIEIENSSSTSYIPYVRLTFNKKTGVSGKILTTIKRFPLNVERDATGKFIRCVNERTNASDSSLELICNSLGSFATYNKTTRQCVRNIIKCGSYQVLVGIKNDGTPNCVASKSVIDFTAIVDTTKKNCWPYPNHIWVDKTADKKKLIINCSH